jgi:pimeloyl-ACP methyl ester carboxylesterase
VADRGLHVDTHGKGPPLLLVAGLGQGAWVWRHVAPALARDRRVITFDNRGTGRSPAPARSSIHDLAADAASVLTAPADVVGFSMGGYVALTLATSEPALVRSLVLAGTGAGGPDRVRRPDRVRAAFAEAIGLPYEEFGRRTMPYTFAPGWPEAHPRDFEEILTARLEHPTSYKALEAHVAACYGFYEEACRVELIEAPALVVHGRADLIVPVENGRNLAARLPNAEYVELPDRGHNLMLEDPNTFVQLVERFLEH